MNRSYDYHGTDDVTETEHERLSRVTGVPVDVVAAVFAEPVPGLLRTDAEVAEAYVRVERGEAAEFELAYRAMVNDCSPVDVYPDDDLDAA